jgi:transcriptional regulator with XRE-family HTH domain
VTPPVGDLRKKFRTHWKKTQRAFAIKYGLQESTLSRWLNGKSNNSGVADAVSTWLASINQA